MIRNRDPKQLVVLARDGDVAALEVLLLTHWEMLCAHLARRIPASADITISAEDVAQETLCEAFHKIDRLREATPRGFVAWLKAFGEVSLARTLRHRGRLKRGGHYTKIDTLLGTSSASGFDVIDQLPDDVKTASSLLARTEALAALQVAVASLPPKQREAVQLHLLQGMSLDQTAKAMATTPGAVRGLVHRGKDKIVESMGQASKWFRNS